MQSAYFVNRALDFVKRRDGHPFAMVVGFYDPHSPFNFPRGWKARYHPDQFAVPPISERDRGAAGHLRLADARPGPRGPGGLLHVAHVR